MSQKVELKVSEKTAEGKAYFEATVSVPGLKATKVAKQDGTTRFGTAASAKTAAARVAEKNGWTVFTPEKAPVKQAAKKTAKTTAKTTKSKTAAPAACPTTGTCTGSC